MDRDELNGKEREEDEQHPWQVHHDKRHWS